MVTGILRALPEGSEARARHHLTARRHYAVAADSTLERARAHPGQYAYTPDGGCWVTVRDGWWEAGDSARDEQRAADRAHPAVHPARLGTPPPPSDEQPYVLEAGGCWHAVAAAEGARWTSVCGLTGQPYARQPSSITYLTSPPSPLCCRHPAPTP